MTRDERERLADIKEAIAAIHAHLATAGDNTDDPLLHDALLFQFVVIGEAVKHLASETREAMPAIPWQNIAGLRDLINGVLPNRDPARARHRGARPTSP